jgi:hypothetical protein
MRRSIWGETIDGFRDECLTRVSVIQPSINKYIGSDLCPHLFSRGFKEGPNDLMPQRFLKVLEITIARKTSVAIGRPFPPEYVPDDW